MATRRHSFVAIANIASGLIIPITISQTNLGLIPNWINFNFIYILSFLSILSGLFLLDSRFYKYGIFFTLPAFLWSFIAIDWIQTSGDLLSFVNYFMLWVLIISRMYNKIYGRDFIIGLHRWVGLTIIVLSIAVALGNEQVGAISHFINRTNINHEYYGVFLGIFGLILMTKNIRISRTVLALSLPMIVQDIYIILYLVFIGETKAVIPFLILKVILIGKISEENYDVW